MFPPRGPKPGNTNCVRPGPRSDSGPPARGRAPARQGGRLPREAPRDATGRSAIVQGRRPTPCSPQSPAVPGSGRSETAPRTPSLPRPPQHGPRAAATVPWAPRSSARRNGRVPGTVAGSRGQWPAHSSAGRARHPARQGPGPGRALRGGVGAGSVGGGRLSALT